MDEAYLRGLDSGIRELFQEIGDQIVAVHPAYVWTSTPPILKSKGGLSATLSFLPAGTLDEVVYVTVWVTEPPESRWKMDLDGPSLFLVNKDCERPERSALLGRDPQLAVSAVRDFLARAEAVIGQELELWLERRVPR